VETRVEAGEVGAVQSAGKPEMKETSASPEVEDEVKEMKMRRPPIPAVTEEDVAMMGLAVPVWHQTRWRWSGQGREPLRTLPSRGSRAECGKNYA